LADSTHSIRRRTRAPEINGLDLVPSGSITAAQASHHLTFRHDLDEGTNIRTHGANQEILIDHGTFDNLPSAGSEWRVNVRGYDNTQPSGVMISNSHFGGGWSDGAQLIGGA
jgi:hypothetical protein